MVLDNLQGTIGRKFPSPQTSSLLEFTTECGICFGYELNGAIPSKVQVCLA